MLAQWLGLTGSREAAPHAHPFSAHATNRMSHLTPAGARRLVSRHSPRRGCGRQKTNNVVFNATFAVLNPSLRDANFAAHLERREVAEETLPRMFSSAWRERTNRLAAKWHRRNVRDAYGASNNEGVAMRALYQALSGILGLRRRNPMTFLLSEAQELCEWLLDAVLV